MSVYYDAEKFGLTIVDTLEEPDLSYEFNTFLVLKHAESGMLFYCRDKGCSCPTPFEDYHFKNPDDHNLEVLNRDSWSNFETSVANFPAPQGDRVKFMDKVRDAL